MKKIILTSFFTSVLTLLIFLLILSIKNNKFITFKDIGQINLDNNSKLEVDTFVSKNLVVNSGNDIILNAGNDFISIRVGTSEKIKITRERIDINTENLFINGVSYKNN